MARYLLTLLEGSGEHEFITRHLVEAEDRQHVKYHYHRTLKDWGYRDAPWGDKHSLQGYRGLSAEIHEIKELTRAEYQFLNEFLTVWEKI